MEKIVLNKTKEKNSDKKLFTREEKTNIIYGKYNLTLKIVITDIITKERDCI